MMTMSTKCTSGTLAEDRLSSLPNDLLTNHILPFLSTKESVSTSMLSTRWRHLYKSRLDRLSSLPDGILTGYILSRLSTKESFNTSILSTRWEHLFKSVPLLNFGPVVEALQDFGGYVKFINKVLELHNVSSIRSFRLFLPVVYNRQHCKSIDSWVLAASLRNPQLLEVDTGDILSPYYFPVELLTCRRLVHLKLSGAFELINISTVCIISLKTLYICGCIIGDGDSVTNLLLGCPILEDFTIGPRSLNLHIKFLSVCVPSLKRLTINCNYCLYNTCVWELNVPNVEYLNCDGYVIKWYSLTILKSLRKACIGLKDLYANSSDPDDRLWELINKCNEVQFLSLSGELMQSIASDSFSLPMFNKLLTLELKSKFWPKWKTFLTLLKRAPCLQVFVVHVEEFSDYNEEFPEINVLRPKSIPLCFTWSLKEVKLCKFRGDEVEYKWLLYILMNAKVIEKLIINVPYKSYMEEFKKKILSFPRRSKTCQIVFKGVNDYTKC